MKRIFIALLVVTQLSVFAQDTTTQISDVERVVDKYVDKTTKALEGLAEALKVPADHVYTVLIKQQKVNAMTWLVMGGISLFMVMVSVFIGWMGNRNRWDEGWIVFIVVSGCVLFGIPLVTSIFHASTIMTGFYNPEYGAIKEISNMINPK